MKMKDIFRRLFFSLLFSSELFLLTDVFLYLSRYINWYYDFETPHLYAAALFSFYFVVWFLLSFWAEKLTRILPLVIAGIFGTVLVVQGIFSASAIYRDPSNHQASLFEAHRVMLIVPHEDDDLNVMGGILEQYTSQGSDVYVLFVTNGDYFDISATRIREAINCLALCGVSEDHVIFLGYGDKWAPDGPHIYNAPLDTPIVSAAGYTATYGTENHPAFHDGNLYTAQNYFADMRDVILEYQPDTIFCVDLDPHMDHRAASLTFEKVIGKILQEDTDYRPVILKGFAYDTAWKTEDDFYSVNIHSTVFSGNTRIKNAPYYLWSERLRLPLRSSDLSHSLLSTSIFRQLWEYPSQQGIEHAARLCNGDKVFWERSCASLAYDARVTASSGAYNTINDFMLADDPDLLSDPFPGKGGIWIPDANDSRKSLTLTFPEPREIRWIYLYDNPDETQNVLCANILLEDGRIISTGALDPHGSATRIPLEAVARTITIELTQTQGAAAGLTEIEVYSQEPVSSFSFIKIMDEASDFAYDYQASEETRFSLYCSGNAPELSSAAYQVSTDNDTCSASIEGNRILVFCPRGSSCTLTVASNDRQYTDSILLSNRNTLIPFGQRMEQTLIQTFFNTYFYSVLKNI